MNNRQHLQYIREFTKIYQQFDDSDIFAREMAIQRFQFKHILQPIQEGDLFAGRMKYAALTFSPQVNQGFGYSMKRDIFLELSTAPEFSSQEKEEIEKISKYWQENDTAVKTRAAYPEKMAEILPSDNWTGESGIAFPLYRMSGSQLDYDKLLRLGIPGMRKEIESAREKQPRSHSLYDHVQQALDLLAECATSYAKQAEKRAETADSQLKQELEAIAQSCYHISTNAPQTFHQAVQLFWLYALLSGNVDYGRMDIYLGDFFTRDIQQGTLAKENAVHMLMSLWRLMYEREEPGNWRFDSRVILGGKGRRNEQNADEFAFAAMEATRRYYEIIPQLTLRFYRGQNEQLYKIALDIISEGLPYPMLYNDDVNIPAVEKAFDVPTEIAEQFIPFGCGEYMIDHQSFDTPSGIINHLQALLVTLHDGIDPTTGEQMGVNFHRDSFETFDDLFSAYQKQCEYYIDQLALQEKLEYQIAAETAPFLFLSMLYDDCIEKGKAIFDGGVRFLGGTIETYGNSNTADALTAIKKYVYDEKQFTLQHLYKVLNTNFEGFAREHKLLLDAPKYGNDLKEADDMLVAVNSHICNYVRDQKHKTGLHHYLVVVINNEANTILGRYTQASPDGRKAGEPLNNGNAPVSGRDKNGITAFLNSIVKAPINCHAGATQNMKFSKSLFRDHREKVDILLDTYWQNGGAQAMLTCIGKQDLENALLYPEKYQNLIVRVGGFSMRFVDLAPDVQQEVLARTLY